MTGRISRSSETKFAPARRCDKSCVSSYLNLFRLKTALSFSNTRLIKQVIHNLNSIFRESANIGKKVHQGLDDLDFYIGNEGVRSNYATKWPLRHGIIEDWDLYERFMEQIIFKYLRLALF